MFWLRCSFRCALVGLAAYLLILPIGPASSFILNDAGADTITWTGTNSNDWDTSTENWSGDDTIYSDGDAVTFDDTSSVVTIDVVTEVQPSSITVGGMQNYKFQGSSAIAGATGVTMNGTGTLRFNTPNTFTGTININSGTFLANSAASFGSTDGGTNINNGGTLDINGKDIGSGATASDLITIVGTGGGDGSIVNTSSNEGKFKFLALSGNATIGGSSGQITVRGNSGDLGSVNLGGYDLVKSGSNRLNFQYVDVQNVGNVNITGGTLNLSSISFGDPSKTISVQSGTRLRTYTASGESTAVVSSDIDCYGGTIESSGGSATEITGDLQLLGDSDTHIYVNSSSSAEYDALTISGNISGTQGLVKDDSWRWLYLTGTNTYTGKTTIMKGPMIMRGDATLSSPVIELQQSGSSGTDSRFEVAELSAGYFTLASGQRIRGIGSVVGDLVAAAGSVLEPGLSVGTLYLMDGDLTLQDGALLEFELGDASDPTTSDQIQMIGTAGALNLDGQEFGDFTFTMLASFAEGDVYTLIDAGSVTGSLGSAVSGSLGGGLTGTLSVSGDDLILTVTPVPEPGTWILISAVGLALWTCTRRRRKVSS